MAGRAEHILRAGYRCALSASISMARQGPRSGERSRKDPRFSAALGASGGQLVAAIGPVDQAKREWRNSAVLGARIDRCWKGDVGRHGRSARKSWGCRPVSSASQAAASCLVAGRPGTDRGRPGRTPCAPIRARSPSTMVTRQSSEIWIRDRAAIPANDLLRRAKGEPSRRRQTDRPGNGSG